MQHPDPEPRGRFGPTLAVSLLLLIALYRWAWIDFPPDVDPMAFYAALSHYDLSAGRPHPPGYPLFIGLGRTAVFFGAEAGHALLVVNALLIVVAAASLYFGLAWRGRPKAGFAGSLLLVTHPLVWAATLSSESYFADAAFSCAVFASTGLLRRNAALSLTALFVSLLALGLFRPVSVALLVPLALVCVFFAAAPERRLRLMSLALLIACSAFGLAYAITIGAAGGLAIYQAAVKRVMVASFNGASVFGGAPIRVHVSMVLKLSGWFIGLSAPLLVLALLAERHRRRDGRPLDRRVFEMGWTLASWIAPAFVFYALIYYLKPTYQLIYLPALAIGVACLIHAGPWALPSAGRWLATAALCFAQLGLFLFGTSALPQPLYRLTHAFLAEKDRASHTLVDFVAGLDPQTSLIVWANHSNLSAFSLMLAEGDRHAVTYDASRNELQSLNLYSMGWSPPVLGTLPLRGIRTLGLITVEGGATVMRVVPVDAGKGIDAALIADALRQSATAR